MLNDGEVKLMSELRASIDYCIKDLKEVLGSGACLNYDSYKYCVGQIAAYNTVMSLMEKYERRARRAFLGKEDEDD